MRKMTISKQLAATALAAALLACALPAAHAGTEMADTKDMKGVTPPECGLSDWSLEASSGVQWSNVRAGTYRGYTIAPIELTALLKVDDVSLDNFLGGVFRGYTQFLFRGQYDFIPKGPEDHYEGLLVGPRYNFVQPGWKIVPFVEGTVGIGFADSKPQLGGLGQDFNFSFEVAAGAKYNINCNWYVSLAAQYQHISNAGLSGPVPNNPVDALGPIVSVGYNF
jgi:opacity protein-like surface antigen